MADTKLVRMDADVADGASIRLFGLAAIARAIHTAIEGGDDEARRGAPDALRLLADDIVKFAVELDVCAWSDAKRQLDAESIARRNLLKGLSHG